MAATLRPRKGKPLRTDRPFASAKVLDEAIRVAALHPTANMGGDLGFAIEVRPIEFLEQMQPLTDNRSFGSAAETNGV